MNADILNEIVDNYESTDKEIEDMLSNKDNVDINKLKKLIYKKFIQGIEITSSFKNKK